MLDIENEKEKRATSDLQKNTPLQNGFIRTINNIMRQLLRKTLEILAYVFKRDGFFTKKLVVGTMTLIMMLFVDIQCGIWNGMGLMLLVLLTLYVICLYMIRYMEMKREDKRMEEKKGETDGVGENVKAEEEKYCNKDKPGCGKLETKPETSDENALLEKNASDRHVEEK